MKPKISVIQRLINNSTFNPDSGCWEWQRHKSSWGYGVIKVSGKACLAHRVSYKIYNGEFDDSLCVLHKCDNPGCINPKHLFLGSNLDNVNDKVSKNRQSFTPGKQGEASHYAKITEKDVFFIRDSELTQKQLGKMFNVSRANISLIKNRYSWKHI